MAYFSKKGGYIVALFTNTGLPGIGKTEYSTMLALKHYKDTNNFIKKTVRYVMKKPLIVNNIYSNYPILLDKKRNIYSNKVMVEDLNLEHRFLKGSFISIDEPQLEDDALDYEYFDRRKAMFMQLHRHFGIDSIVFTTQHPNRLIVFEKQIMAYFQRITRTIKIPFLPYKILFIRRCYELADYEAITTRDKNRRKENDIETKFSIINIKKVHSSYNDKYFAPLNSKKPLLNKGTYNSLEMDEVTLNYYRKKIEEYRKIAENKAEKRLKAATRNNKATISASKPNGAVSGVVIKPLDLKNIKK